jgi:hypothetical protein
MSTSFPGSFRISRATSKPSMSGKLRSRRTTSGSNERAPEAPFSFHYDARHCARPLRGVSDRLSHIDIIFDQQDTSVRACAIVFGPFRGVRSLRGRKIGRRTVNWLFPGRADDHDVPRWRSAAPC